MTWSGGLMSGRTRVTLVVSPLLLVSLFVSPPLFAGDLLDLNVTDSKGVYSIDVEMLVHAPVGDVWHVLTDFTHIYRLNTSITESELLPAPDKNVVRVRTQMYDCVFVFCFDIERVEDVRVTAVGELKARVVKDMSNVKSGTAVWSITPDGADSHIHYRGTIEPGFDVVPIIGNYIVRYKLRKEILLTLENVEHISRIQAGLEVKPASEVVVSNLP